MNGIDRVVGAFFAVSFGPERAVRVRNRIDIADDPAKTRMDDSPVFPVGESADIGAGTVEHQVPEGFLTFADDDGVDTGTFRDL